MPKHIRKDYGQALSSPVAQAQQAVPTVPQGVMAPKAQLPAPMVNSTQQALVGNNVSNKSTFMRIAILALVLLVFIVLYFYLRRGSASIPARYFY